jgi:hypothetical protein
LFEHDLLLAFVFMAILFLRQISILKQPNKINYAPLMIGIGAISSLVHFIIHPDTQDVIHLIRESILPLLVALLLYIVMNILHQTQQTESSRAKDEFTKGLIAQVTQLKEFMAELEGRMILSQQEDQRVQEEVRGKFREDIKALDAIKVNQVKFLEKFEDMDKWHEKVSQEFETLINVQMPEFDSVVNKHIQVLRVSERDHFNQLKVRLEEALEERVDVSEDIAELKESLENMKSMSENIANTIIKHTLQHLSTVSREFEGQLISLKSHTEGLKTSLFEDENRLSSIREQSEIILKQMVLSSNKMSELESKNKGLHDIYTTINDLMSDIEAVKSDYVKAQSQLMNISSELQTSEDEQLEAMRNQIESLSEELSKKIDESLEKLHEHFHIADGDISQSVQFLAKRSQLKGYIQN